MSDPQDANPAAAAEASDLAPGLPAPGTLAHRLRDALAEELVVLLRETLAELDPVAVRQALHNPFCSREAVGLIAGQARLLAFYAVRRDLALHVQSPETLALRLLPGLYWRDLMLVGLDARLRPTLRRAAEQHLLSRLSEIALGEKIALARRASPGVLLQLRHDPNPRVMEALLDNPRLTEGLLAPILHSSSTPAGTLDSVIHHRRWGNRYNLRLAVARNPTAATETALRLLPGLRKVDLRSVASDPKLGGVVRQRARLLLGEASG